MVTAHDAAFQETPEAFDGLSVNCTDYILARTVPHDSMRQIAAKQPVS